MPELLGPARPKVAGAFKVVDVVDLGGLFIKSVTAAGLITYQDANDTEQTIQISISGFDLHGGSAAPAASLGASGDWYLRFSNGQWLEKVNTTWHGRYTPPQLSDAAPLATSTSADEGTGLASSREDHIHVGLALGSQQPEDTDNAADTGARGFASREDHVHAVGFGTGNVESVGDRQCCGGQSSPGAARPRSRRRYCRRRARPLRQHPAQHWRRWRHWRVGRCVPWRPHPRRATGRIQQPSRRCGDCGVRKSCCCQPERPRTRWRRR